LTWHGFFCILLSRKFDPIALSPQAWLMRINICSAVLS